MIEIVGIVLLAVVLISNRSLSSRISILEAKLKGGASVGALASGPVTPPVSQPINSAPVITGGMQEYATGSPVAAAFDAALQPVEPGALDRLGIWFKEDWLMKIGGLLIVIGCGWFVSYAFANNWIGPVGRISIGIIAGVLVMAFGFWRMIRFPHQGGVFMALGAGMAILSILAGRSIYQFFTPASATVFDFVIAAFVSFASYKFNLRSLALTAQILAFVAPLLVAGQTDSIFLFSYLLVISLATLVLAGLMAWRGLILTSLVFVGMYSIPYIIAPHGASSMYSTDASIVLNYAYVFAMLYLLTGMYAVIRRGVQEVSDEIMLAVMNGAFLFFWVYNVPGAEWQTLLFAAWAIVFGVGSFIAYRFSAKPDPFYAYGSVAVAFIAAATAAQLDGAALTIAFTIEVCLLVTIVLALTKNVKAATATALLFIAPVLLSFASMSRYLVSSELFTKDAFVLLILAFSLIVTGRLIRTAEKEQQVGDDTKLWAVCIIFGTIYIWFVIWCFLHVLMPLAPDMATFSALTVYTVAGLWAYFAGLSGNDAARKVYGAALLVFVVVRLLFVDVWNMELSGRVITFFVIGILLMSTAFLTKRKTAVKPLA